jgi:hypothetical protein
MHHTAAAQCVHTYYDFAISHIIYTDGVQVHKVFSITCYLPLTRAALPTRQGLFEGYWVFITAPADFFHLFLFPTASVRLTAVHSLSAHAHHVVLCHRSQHLRVPSIARSTRRCSSTPPFSRSHREICGLWFPQRSMCSRRVLRRRVRSPPKRP